MIKNNRLAFDIKTPNSLTSYPIVSFKCSLFDVSQGTLIQYVHSGVCLLECLHINTLQRHRLNSLNGATQAAIGSLLLLRICVYVPVCLCI